MNDEDWMKKRSWRKNSGCAFVALVGIGLPYFTLAYSTYWLGIT